MNLVRSSSHLLFRKREEWLRWHDAKRKDWEMMRTTTIKLWTQIHHGLLMQWLLSEWTGKRARSCGERWLEKFFLAPLPPFFSRSSCTTCKKKTYSMETFTRRNSSTTHSGSWARLDHQLACSQSLAHHHACSAQLPKTGYSVLPRICNFIKTDTMTSN